ncbi:MAG: dihydrodipicolinate synthase family protein [Caulobacteraceae bacterium]
MTKPPPRVLAAIATPFEPGGGRIDHALLADHARWLLASGCDGLVLFGTTGEAASCSLGERQAALDALVADGVDPGRLIVGTGLCSVAETVALTRHAWRARVFGVLVLPPFYFKEADAEGLRRHFGGVIAACGAELPPIHLYHIPQVSGVPLGPDIVATLLDEHAEAIVGYKDSSGDWSNTAALLERFPGFRVYVGSETLLLRALAAGGAGVISATTNVQPEAAARLVADWRGPAAKAQQERLTAVRRAMEAFRPLIGPTKALLAEIHGREAWAEPRPPLSPLSSGERARLLADLRALEVPALA